MPSTGGRRPEKKADRKAAKTLAAILLAFVLTWTPYNINVLIEVWSPGSVNSWIYAGGNGERKTKTNGVRQTN